MKRYIRLLALFLLASCVKTPEVVFEYVGTHYIEMGEEGGSVEASVTSNTNWSFSSSEAWFHITPSSGSASEAPVKITFVCDPNTSEEPRQLTVELKVGQQSEHIDVKQNAKSVVAGLSSRYEVSNEEQDLVIEFQTNTVCVPVIADNCKTWIATKTTKAMESKSLTLHISANTTYDAREGTVSLVNQSNAVLGTITIAQSEKYALFATQTVYELSNEAHSFYVELKHNVDYDITIPEDAKTWINIEGGTGTKGLETTSYQVFVDKNAVSDSRSAVITFQQKGGGLSGSVTINQDKINDAIVFADSKIKAALVEHFDTDKDGELSYREAAAVTSIADVFEYEGNYYSFDEFQYFTGVTTVPYNFFRGCKQFCSIILPPSLTVIEGSSFYGCLALKSLTIPDSVEEIGSFAFANCQNCTSINVPANVRSIGQNAYWSNNGLADVVLPASLTSIGTDAFAGSSITSVQIGANIESIPKNCFSGCTYLKTVVLSEGLKYIKEASFSYSGVESIVLPNSVEEIEYMAFASSPYLYNIEIGTGIKRLESNLFAYTRKLTLTCRATTPPDTHPDFLLNASNQGQLVIRVPSESVAAYKAATAWSAYSDRIRAIGESKPTPEAVDMGLSVRWASFNVGAEYPLDTGDMFAWGETEPKGEFRLETYKWYLPGIDWYTKYTYRGPENPGDNKLTLDLEDDAAHAYYGGKWRMPTVDEIRELANNTTSEKINVNGVTYLSLCSNKTGNTILLPYPPNDCWSSSINNVGYVDAYGLNIQGWSSGNSTSSKIRYDGAPVRAVYDPNL